MEDEEVFEVNHHRPILISMRKSLDLYLNRSLKEWSCISMIKKCVHNKWFTTRDKRMMKLYKRAEQQINEDLDMVKIIKLLREVNILSTFTQLNNFSRFQIDHAHKNVINLESDDECVSDFSSCA